MTKTLTELNEDLEKERKAKALLDSELPAT